MTRVNEESPAITTGLTGSDVPSRVTAESSGASLDKVRDILFGVQMREVERRFSRLEERLVKETTELKEDVKRRLEALEGYARHESEALAEQIRKEQQRTATLDDQLSKHQRESRQQLLEQHQRLSDEIRTRVDDLLATLMREAQELRSEKADRALLASLLNEMAMRLTGGLTISDVEELGNA